MRLVAVHAPRANRFMREILEAVVFEANAAGATAELVDGAFPDDDDAVYLVIPHEYFACTDPEDWPEDRLLTRTIALTVEHPGTQWFEISATQARRCARIVDINRDSTAELVRRGQPASHFQLGYSASFDAWGGGERARQTDVVYLGSTDPKRDRLLASYAPLWVDSRVRLLIPGHEPKVAESGDFVEGRSKFELLADSRIMLNLHRDRSRALEWVRVLEGMANGAVVFSEHSVDASPLVAQQHFISASGESLGIMVANALGNEAYLDDLRRRAYEFVTTRLRLSTSVERLLEIAESLLSAPAHVPAREEVARPEGPAMRRPAWQTVVDVAPRDPRVRSLEHRVKRLADTLKAHRGVQSEVVERFASPSHPGARPRVSVLIPAYDADEYIGEALESLVPDQGIEFEVLVHDDGSLYPSAPIVRAFSAEHPEIPVAYVGAGRNRGLAAARNSLLARARGEYVFTLDADNGVFEGTLGRLAQALDADPDAAFAYSAIGTYRGGTHRSGQAQGLLSERAWNPAEFRFGNYIDNMALYRTERVRQAGGWSSEVLSWEDFHLYLRFAESGEYGVFVPQVLSWYRVVEQSLSQQAGAYLTTLWAQMRAAAPNVLHD